MTVTYNILVCGVGGQGVISAAGILARAAIASGQEARMYGSYGMAQRGGMVSAQLRIGKRVQNAKIEEGGAHMLLSMELTEALRSAPMLSSGGALFAADVMVPPVGKLIKDGGAAMRQLLGTFPSAVLVDVGSLCGPAGPRGVNAVLLGAASSVNGFPVGTNALEATITGDGTGGSTMLVDAFRRGREFMARPGR
jgi:indolepyruvate ferredoxin oxidoreductase beta subunit